MTSRIYVSPEECQEMFSAPSDDDEWYIDIPEWHKQILRERITRYRAEGFVGIPLEEFEKKWMEEFEQLMKK